MRCYKHRHMGVEGVHFGGRLDWDFPIMRQRLIGQAIVGGRTGHKRTVLALAVSALLTGCGATINNPFSTAPPPEEEIPTISERFDQVFGGRGKVSETAPDGTEVDCPVVKIRAGASTYGVAPPGKQPVASELNYQATITRTARDCRRIASDGMPVGLQVVGRALGEADVVCVAAAVEKVRLAIDTRPPLFR